jgi:hypothetical protein
MGNSLRKYLSRQGKYYSVSEEIYFSSDTEKIMGKRFKEWSRN